MRKSVLFVEDNPVLLQAYALMLQRDAACWEVATASDGHTALELMAQKQFDVVVTDMRLQGVSGLDLLKEVRRRNPRTARIVISGITDQEEVARSLGTTHQFLAKPVGAKALKGTLARIVGLENYLQGPELQALVARLRAVPSFPSVYFELLRELQADDPSIEKLAQIVSQDPALAAKTLQVVNSAAFGRFEKTSDLAQAVQYLGSSSLRSIVLSFQVFSFFERERRLPPGFAEQLWQHSMRTGTLARKLMVLDRFDLSDADEACIAGMLHDMGKLMLAHNVPDQFAAAVGLSTRERIPLHEAELKVFGATHACVAAYLLGLWGLPASIVEAVAFHHTPSRGNSDHLSPLAAVHVANVLDHEFSEPAGKSASAFDVPYLEACASQDRVQEWRTALRDSPA